MFPVRRRPRRVYSLLITHRRVVETQVHISDRMSYPISNQLPLPIGPKPRHRYLQLHIILHLHQTRLPLMFHPLLQCNLNLNLNLSHHMSILSHQLHRASSCWVDRPIYEIFCRKSETQLGLLMIVFQATLDAAIGYLVIFDHGIIGV